MTDVITILRNRTDLEMLREARHLRALADAAATESARQRMSFTRLIEAGIAISTASPGGYLVSARILSPGIAIAEQQGPRIVSKGRT